MSTRGRRVYQRYSITLPVTVSNAGHATSGTILNLSLGGCSIARSTPIAFGAQVELKVVLPPLREETTIPAVVRWLKDDLLGLQFGSLRAKEVWALNRMFREAKAAYPDSRRP